MWDWNLPANHVKAWDFLPHFLFRSYHSSYPHWVHWLKSKLAAILKRFCCHSNYSYAYFRCSFWFLKSCYIPDSYILTKYQCTRFWIWNVFYTFQETVWSLLNVQHMKQHSKIYKIFLIQTLLPSPILFIIINFRFSLLRILITE